MRAGCHSGKSVVDAEEATFLIFLQKIRGQALRVLRQDRCAAGWPEKQNRVNDSLRLSPAGRHTVAWQR